MMENGELGNHQSWKVMNFTNSYEMERGLQGCSVVGHNEQSRIRRPLLYEGTGRRFSELHDRVQPVR